MGEIKFLNSALRDPAEFQSIMQEAVKAGVTAGNSAPPPEMVKIGERFGKTIWGNPVGRTGQAWVSFGSGTAWAKWVRANGYGSNVPAGGYGVFIRMFGQDGVRKGCYARAFAQVLNDHGIHASAHIMMD